ncbi:hypothetical protein LC048_15345 [Mesobacillus subterraneus]|uniref:hypothetical protein n=1 Tax=Mesobacillus subterraneus TaxID=285983 RepID=UPI001CFD82EF|nr:hypothetical protein [Mesobacillus subterraneus]WLR53874.1 hypothetical protein LC048_15345 [Mesobacillus subterraneus]
MTSLAGPKRLEELGAAARQATRGARRWSWIKKTNYRKKQQENLLLLEGYDLISYA